MKVLLHQAELSEAFGVLCSLVTLSPISHASIVHQGVRYDTTASRGHFGKAHPLVLDGPRKVIAVDIPDADPRAWLATVVGIKYDAVGLLLWPWGRENPERMYCFEAVSACLKSVGVDLGIKGRVGGGDILDGLLQRGFKASVHRSDDPKVNRSGG